MVTAATSSSTEVAEELLSYFVDIGNKECFAALLFTCFDLLRSDVVEELSWQHGLNDFYMPYKIQSQRSLVEKVCILFEIYDDVAADLNSHSVGRFGEGGEGAGEEGDPKGADRGGRSNHQPRTHGQPSPFDARERVSATSIRLVTQYAPAQLYLLPCYYQVPWSGTATYDERYWHGLCPTNDRVWCVLMCCRCKCGLGWRVDFHDICTVRVA